MKVIGKIEQFIVQAVMICKLLAVSKSHESSVFKHDKRQAQKKNNRLFVISQTCILFVVCNR